MCCNSVIWKNKQVSKKLLLPTYVCDVLYRSSQTTFFISGMKISHENWHENAKIPSPNSFAPSPKKNTNGIMDAPLYFKVVSERQYSAYKVQRKKDR
jgi:hypothetical protein